MVTIYVLGQTAKKNYCLSLYLRTKVLIKTPNTVAKEKTTRNKYVPFCITLQYQRITATINASHETKNNILTRIVFISFYQLSFPLVFCLLTLQFTITEDKKPSREARQRTHGSRKEKKLWFLQTVTGKLFYI